MLASARVTDTNPKQPGAPHGPQNNPPPPLFKGKKKQLFVAVHLLRIERGQSRVTPASFLRLWRLAPPVRTRRGRCSP